ncbi:MAG: ThuA domain-containing protein [Thermoguttaceae bacterium]|nr:ThuA domain-containing protein [Thermoguttaceae bacterium]
MLRRDFVKTAGMAAGLCLPVWSTLAFGAESKGRKLLYFDLSTEWEHPPTVDEADGNSFAGKIVKKLGDSLGFQVDCTKNGAVFDGDLSQYAAFIFYTCGDLDVKVKDKIPVSQSGMKKLFEAIRGGTGFVGIHSATDTWQCKGPVRENQSEAERTEYIKMVGGDFITHGKMQETTLTFVEPVQLPYLKSLGKKSVRAFDEWYCMKNFNKDMHVLIVQETEGMDKKGRNTCYDRPCYPSTWVRMEGKGRVAYTSLGHDNMRWETPLLQGIVTDLISFAAGNLDLDTTPNLDKVCPGASIFPNHK